MMIIMTNYCYYDDRDIPPVALCDEVALRWITLGSDQPDAGAPVCDV